MQHSTLLHSSCSCREGLNECASACCVGKHILPILCTQHCIRCVLKCREGLRECGSACCVERASSYSKAIDSTLTTVQPLRVSEQCACDSLCVEWLACVRCDVMCRCLQLGVLHPHLSMVRAYRAVREAQAGATCTDMKECFAITTLAGPSELGSKQVQLVQELLQKGGAVRVERPDRAAASSRQPPEVCVL